MRAKRKCEAWLPSYSAAKTLLLSNAKRARGNWKKKNALFYMYMGSGCELYMASHCLIEPDRRSIYMNRDLWQLKNIVLQLWTQDSGMAEMVHSEHVKSSRNSYRSQGQKNQIAPSVSTSRSTVVLKYFSNDIAVTFAIVTKQRETAFT